MEISDAIKLQIETLLNIPSRTVDLAPLNTRVAKLETDLQSLSNTVVKLAEEIAKRVNQKTFDDAIAELKTTFSSFGKSIFVESKVSPAEIAPGTYPDWRIWLQETVLNSRSYAAVYIRSTTNTGSIKIWDGTGAIVATQAQDLSWTYTGVTGANIRYTNKRAADSSYTIWLTLTEQVVNSTVVWVAFDDKDVECSRGNITALNGDIHQFFPKVQAKTIRLEFDWVDPAKVNSLYSFGVS